MIFIDIISFYFLQICGGDTPFLAPSELESKHEVLKAKALTLFRATRKMGGEEFSSEFEQRLEDQMDELFENFVKLNDSKNIFNAARTPAVFLVVMTTAYMVSGFFTMLGITSFANLFNLILGVFLIGIILWGYIRFSGELIDLGKQLDSIAEWIWDEVCRVCSLIKGQLSIHFCCNMTSSSIMTDFRILHCCCSISFTRHRLCYPPNLVLLDFCSSGTGPTIYSGDLFSESQFTNRDIHASPGISTVKSMVTSANQNSDILSHSQKQTDRREIDKILK